MLSLAEIVGEMGPMTPLEHSVGEGLGVSGGDSAQS